MENILLAATNFTSLYPLYIAWNNDIITFIILLNVTLASIFSHLFECHKHDMRGYYFHNKTLSYVLNRWDVIGCMIMIMRLLYMLYNLHLLWILSHYFRPLFMLYIVLSISEYDKYNPYLKYVYICMHSIWHLGIFIIIGDILSKIY